MTQRASLSAISSAAKHFDDLRRRLSAASDIYYLYHAMLAHYQNDDDSGLQGYSAKALARIWKAQRFSWWMTMLLHRFPDRSEYEDRLQQTELKYLLSSETAQRLLAENYVGLPF